MDRSPVGAHQQEGSDQYSPVSNCIHLYAAVWTSIAIRPNPATPCPPHPDALVPLIHRLVHLIQATRHASFETPLFQYAAQSRLGHDDGASDSSQFHSCPYAILAIHAPDPTINTYPPMHPQCQHRQATSRPCTKPSLLRMMALHIPTLHHHQE